MSKVLEYKGYLGSVAYSDADGVWHGRLEFIRDLVTYESETADTIEAAFQEAVDDHLEWCEAEGRPPDMPLNGSFSVRPGRALHRRACCTPTAGASISTPWSATRSASISAGKIGRSDCNHAESSK